MLIEQIIEFELRGHGLSSPTCSPQTGYFHGKTKLSKANTRIIIRVGNIDLKSIIDIVICYFLVIKCKISLLFSFIIECAISLLFAL